MAGGCPFVCKQERAVAVRKLDPEGARRFAHFSQAVLVEVPGPTLYVAGQGDVTGDFEIQARKAWTQIEVLLNEAGMTRPCPASSRWCEARAQMHPGDLRLLCMGL